MRINSHNQSCRPDGSFFQGALRRGDAVRKRHACVGKRSAFTMIEIAISLAVIAFALVAIIGVLPTGMSVQSENREDTIINQDGPYWLEGIRNGSKGLDQLTNFVERIGVVTVNVNLANTPSEIVSTNAPDYTFYDRPENKTGSNIVGLLSIPKFSTNYTQRRDVQVFAVEAQVRALTGSATEQGLSNPDFAFSYVLRSEVIPFRLFATDTTNYLIYLNVNPPSEWLTRSNRWVEAYHLPDNSHEIRLSFRWPFLAEGRTGPGRQVFRSVIAGQLRPQRPENRGSPLFFFQPQTFVKQ